MDGENQYKLDHLLLIYKYKAANKRFSSDAPQASILFTAYEDASLSP
jgi:hypothetical protein